MPDSLLDELRRERREAHRRLLALVQDLSDEQLAWRPGPHAPGIGFHLWHTARWVDLDRQLIGGGDQVWHSQSLAQRWGIDETTLGGTGTGTGMGDDASERLLLPARPELVAYASAAFEAFDGFLQTLAEADLARETVSPFNPQVRISAANVLVSHLSHDNRHLGMIEALRGLLGLRGTATA